MKSRQGFVSNSSTSSFILITTKENFDKCYNELNDVEKKIVDFVTDEAKFLDTDCRTIEYIQGNYSTFEYDDPELTSEDFEKIEEEYDYCREDFYWEVINKFEEKVSEGETFCRSIDM